MFRNSIPRLFKQNKFVLSSTTTNPLQPPPSLQNHELLRDYYSIVQINTHWGELDAFGHINNIWSFRYFETCRINHLDLIMAALRKSGHEQQASDFKHARGVGPILSTSSCKYKRPGMHPDLLLVGVYVTELLPDRFTEHYRIVSTGNNAVMSEGVSQIVAFDYKAGKKGLWTPEVIRAIHDVGPVR
eukprot:PhF_6_TR38876/c0_g1_i2/m.58142/K07107/ybgC; acyl-CoA thioester hydrolase